MHASALVVEARLRSGLSRRELARRAGTSAATLAAYEAGRITPGRRTGSNSRRCWPPGRSTSTACSGY
ncbi:MAG: helix-turn-helix transcriptional regulator [Actinomycetota bacterium]